MITRRQSGGVGSGLWLSASGCFATFWHRPSKSPCQRCTGHWIGRRIRRLSDWGEEGPGTNGMNGEDSLGLSWVEAGHGRMPLKPLALSHPQVCGLCKFKSTLYALRATLEALEVLKNHVFHGLGHSRISRPMRLTQRPSMHASVTLSAALPKQHLEMRQGTTLRKLS